MAKKNKNNPDKGARQSSPALLEKAIGFLQLHDHVDKIYVNKHGEYHLQPTEGFEEYDAEVLLSAAVSFDSDDIDSDDTVDPVLTDDDFAANPELKEQGLKVGDTIQIPAK